LSHLASRLDFQTLLDQRGRLLQVHTALPTLALIPERMVMREAVSQPFELVIDCLSTSAHFELKQLVGEQVSVGLLQPSGQYKPWHGYVFEAAQLGSDGALARYRLVLKPWICCLEQSLNSRVFESKTARDIIEEVFSAYPEAQFRFEVTDTLRLKLEQDQGRDHPADPPWMKGFGALAELRSETARIQRLVDAEFEQIETEP
jgi:type VI secretion system secreted protein VgrG